MQESVSQNDLAPVAYLNYQDFESTSLATIPINYISIPGYHYTELVAEQPGLASNRAQEIIEVLAADLSGHLDSASQ